MTINDVTNFIIDYVRQHLEDDSQIIDENCNFVSTGYLDSFAILSLIMTLESQYEIKFAPSELAESELQVIGNLAQVVVNKIAGRD
ncbi:acyl carrier protein [Shewanella sp. SP2S2-4]|uniref:Acyl carrier protein n=1 Tax=Shewanella scandinavica TaxID=3063538 RepID=A0ABU3FTW0_9GAMM|nr:MULTISPECIES: acyl carrier protein [unclassified Shewanella]EGT3626479.1 acyl carrier protein [Morganella morganii]MDT3274142.1 acyl carrier protein [Shewanella sp. SP2S2-4]MDT3278766.1 acyl carrier protein [Shewanella sp. SP2S1-2]MDT3294490.1 acyl carrier protein [Shewanella sp. SP2S2-6]MDT3319392.1 acyl carrier protein [Shewanella sp. SP1S2-4]